MIILLPARGQVAAKTPNFAANAQFYKKVFET